MAYRDDEDTPYWLSTIPTLGLDDDPPTRLIDVPLELILNGQLARALSQATNPRIPADLWPFPHLPSHMLPLVPQSNPSSQPAPVNTSAGLTSPPTPLSPSFAPAPPVGYLDTAKHWGVSPRLPESPPPSSADGFYVSPVPQAPSWDSVPTPPADNAAQSFSSPPSPPSWDEAVSPVEYPDLARYWGVPPALSTANEQPLAHGTLPFSGPGYARRSEPSSDHLWVTESSAPKSVPRALVPADLNRRSRDAENALAFARLFAPDLVDYLTTPAPPPQYTPNAAGKIPPIDYHPNEAGAAVDAFNLVTSALPSGGAKLAMAPLLPRAGRMARAKAMGYADEPFYRGEQRGRLPNEYPEGAHFSRDKSYANAWAKRGGQKEAREFRLTLDKTFRDYEDLTAAQYARLVSAADPNLAAGLVNHIAPGKGVEWFAEFARRNPDFKVTRGTSSHIRYIIEKNATDPADVFLRAGCDALDSGRDVRKLGGFGIRLKNADFDPAKAHLRDITASLAVPGAAGASYRLLPVERDPSDY
jgi:hypothetical protein